MIDLLVHHAEVIALKGDSYRLTDREAWRRERSGLELRRGRRPAPEESSDVVYDRAR